ncbi:VPLPA-CTERM sorting domain-containing protein [Sedimentitalea todarodis]|uniref:VPLPA-CTERM sorting domain-containing protein n=1 Tax=Sedimentitalea todarodis TaxID=1631240 RepID=A0ABU3VD79_9RHOB|nr:VPLPA-CTERM sorting domain-containing protein [Sedimentitalea todarodis]MDU9003985.1 VPLPA-CTERM sorting domain-containing protein [Sedimentitalea todarodis]
MFNKNPTILAAAAVALALAGGAQAATLGMFTHDYGTGSGNVAPDQYGSGALNSDSVTVADNEAPRFQDNFDLSTVTGSIERFDLTLTFGNAGPSGWFGLGERWQARILGSDDGASSDDNFVTMYDEASPQTITLSFWSDLGSPDAFAHSVASSMFSFGFSENTGSSWPYRGADEFDLQSASLLVSGTPTPVPLPATMPLLAAALAGLGYAARRRRKS